MGKQSAVTEKPAAAHAPKAAAVDSKKGNKAGKDSDKKSAADKDEIVTLKETLLDIDNRLLRNYINEGTIDSPDRACACC